MSTLTTAVKMVIKDGDHINNNNNSNNNNNDDDKNKINNNNVVELSNEKITSEALTSLQLNAKSFLNKPYHSTRYFRTLDSNALVLG